MGLPFAVHVVGQHHIRPAIGHRLECLGQCGRGDPLNLDIKPRQQRLEVRPLRPPVQSGHAQPPKVQHRFHMQILALVHLRPAVHDGLLMKRKPGRALFTEGNVGHQVQLPFCQRRQALLPLTTNRLDLPPLDGSQLIRQSTEHATGPAIFGHENLGWVVINPHSNHSLRCRGLRAQGQAPSANEPPGPNESPHAKINSWHG